MRPANIIRLHRRLYRLASEDLGNRAMPVIFGSYRNDHLVSRPGSRLLVDWVCRKGLLEWNSEAPHWQRIEAYRFMRRYEGLKGDQPHPTLGAMAMG